MCVCVCVCVFVCVCVCVCVCVWEWGVEGGGTRVKSLHLCRNMEKSFVATAA